MLVAPSLEGIGQAAQSQGRSNIIGVAAAGGGGGSNIILDAAGLNVLDAAGNQILDQS